MALPESTEACGTRPGFSRLAAPTGYISSLVTQETACGGKVTPWRIAVKPGQRINVSLLDFR